MKKMLFAFLATFTCACIIAAPLTRRIYLGETTTLTLTAQNTVVVIAPGASPVTHFAATELQSLLEQILGGKIFLMTEMPKDKIALVVGQNDWSKAAGLDASLLPRDGFYLKTIENRVFIGGVDDPKVNLPKELRTGGAHSFHFERASVFAVYDFLERFAGARFYFPGELGTILPKMPKLALPSIDIVDRPDFTQRSVSTYWDGTYFEGPNPNAVINPAKNINMLRLRFQTERIRCCHGLTTFGYVARFQNKPEYFALSENGMRSNDPNRPYPGHLCYSSGIREEIYQDVKTILSGKGVEKRPGLAKTTAWNIRDIYKNHVDIMPQDSFIPCRCERCKKLYTQEEHFATDLMWNFVAEIGTRLKKESIPGYITMMAYPPYRRVPAVEIPDNILVMVAEMGPWSKSNPAQKQLDNDEINAWTKKLGRKVWLWNYPCKMSNLSIPGVPQMSPRAYGEYYKELAPWIFGAFAESESDRFLYNYLNYYIFAKVAWDNKTDLNALLDEHYRLMFGKAASDMKKFYEQLEDNWVGKIAGRTVDTPLGPIGTPPSDYDLWNEIYTADVLTAMDKDLKDAATLAGKNTLEEKRIALIRKEFYEPLVAAAENYRKMSSAVIGLKFHIADAPGGELYLVPFRKAPGSELKKTVRTGVQVWKTPTDLHIRFVCEEPNMADVAAIKRKSDDTEIWKDNSVEVFLNPSGDRKTYYQFLVNSEGSLSDQKAVKLGATGQNDFGWNSGAAVKVEKQKNLWNAEIAIPLKNLPDLKEEFPANFARNRILKTGADHETLFVWSPFVRDFHDLENYGSLTVNPDKSILINGDFSMPPHGDRHWGIFAKSGGWIEGWIGGNKKHPERHALDDKIFFSAPNSMRIISTERSETVSYWTLSRLKPATRYRLSFMLKIEDVKPLIKGGGAAVSIVCDPNRMFPENNRFTGTMDWARQTYEFTTGKNTNNGGENVATITIRLFAATGTAWFDDVEIVELPQQ